MEEEAKLPFRLKLSGDGIDIDKALDRDTARAVMTVIMGGALGASSGPGAGASSALSRSGPPLSLREFLTDVKAETKPDQIVAIGNFIIENEGQPSFSREDIKARFATAKEPMPANFSRDFGVATKNGMIDEVHGEPGRFYVTRTGQQAVENRFGRSRA